jgi:hypothetical protein
MHDVPNQKSNVKYSLIKYHSELALPANLNTEISSDGTRLGVSRVGLTQHLTASLNNVQTLPDLRRTLHVLKLTANWSNKSLPLQQLVQMPYTSPNQQRKGGQTSQHSVSAIAPQ